MAGGPWIKMAIADTPVLLRTYLVANAALATAVSSRIWVAKVPEDELANMPTKAVLIIPSSSMSNIGVPVYGEQSDMYCYGSTEYEAWTVFRILYNALHRCGLQTVSSTYRIMQGALSSGPAYHTEPVTGWPRVLVTFNVTWLETAVT
jgi:hypothetical protein